MCWCDLITRATSTNYDASLDKKFISFHSKLSFLLQNYSNNQSQDEESNILQVTKPISCIQKCITHQNFLSRL